MKNTLITLILIVTSLSVHAQPTQEQSAAIGLKDQIVTLSNTPLGLSSSSLNQQQPAFIKSMQKNTMATQTKELDAICLKWLLKSPIPIPGLQSYVKQCLSSPYSLSTELNGAQTMLSHYPNIPKAYDPMIPETFYTIKGFVDRYVMVVNIVKGMMDGNKVKDIQNALGISNQ